MRLAVPVVNLFQKGFLRNCGMGLGSILKRSSPERGVATSDI